MSVWQWNGQGYEACATLPVADRGFRYGMALFETIRIWRSRPLFLAEHLQRLSAACADRRFPVDPTAFSALAQQLSSLPDGVARIYVTAGDGLLASTDVTAPRVLILSEHRPPPTSAPCRLTVSPELYHPHFGGLKTANYWPNIDALHQALTSGYDESLLFNENSELVSASTANVFLVRGSEVLTPSLACGARDGVTRAWVMQQTPVRETSIFIGDLRQADEIFLTNSWHGLRPATALESRPLPSCRITDGLAQAYYQQIG